MAYCIMRTEKIKTMGAFTNKMHHNFRIGNVPNADKDRAHLNKTLIEMPDETYADAFKRITKEHNHQPRANAVLGIEVMMTYNANDVDKDFDLDGWSKANIEWLKQEFGEENVISAVLHRDEGPLPEHTKNGAESGHIHAIIIPMVDGKLNAKHFLAGRTKLHEMQTEYAKAMKPFGLVRGLESSVASHDKVQKMYAAINKTFDEHLPSPNKEETIDEYAKRVDDIYLERNLQHLNEIKKKDREIVEIKTAVKSSKTDIDTALSLQSSLAILEKEKKKLEKERKENEDYKRIIESYSKEEQANAKKIRNFDLIQNGLKSYPDREKARKIAEEINEIIHWTNDGEIDKGKSEEK